MKTILLHSSAHLLLDIKIFVERCIKRKVIIQSLIEGDAKFYVPNMAFSITP